MKVGDIVKCLDFPGNELHYMVGEAYMITADMIYCNTLKVVRDSVQSYEALVMHREFRAPKQGEHFLDEKFPGRVSVIS